MKKVYIFGKITGLNYQKTCKKFNSIAAELREKGFIVVNPVELVPEGSDRREAMRILIPELLTCNYGYGLSTWTNSEYAIIEFNILKYLGAIFLNIDLSKFKDEDSKNIDVILGIILTYFGKTAAECFRKTNEIAYCYPRQVCQYYLCKKKDKLNLTYAEIGKRTSNGDPFTHSTIMSTQKKIQGYIDTNNISVKKDLKEINEKLNYLNL